MGHWQKRLFIPCNTTFPEIMSSWLAQGANLLGAWFGNDDKIFSAYYGDLISFFLL